MDPAQAVVLILNYLTAYQVLHKAANVGEEDKVLIIGASGGLGTALIQLGKLADLKMYGLASANKHDILVENGVTAIDYNSQDFVEIIQQSEPDGLNFVLNGMGEEYIERSLAALAKGGTIVHYGGPESFSKFLLLVFKIVLYNILPNGKKIKGYGTHRGDIEQFKDDWATLFKLLESGEINPIISQKFPILEAARANEVLESGKVTGNIVLLSPELF